MSRLVLSPAPPAQVSDEDIHALLHEVYVDGGYTPPAIAATHLQGPAVRARGTLLVALGPGSRLLGMIVVVAPGSGARRLAGAGEAELHLLAVAPSQRGQGLGRALLEAALDLAHQQGAHRVLLWTQPSMEAAQRLYRSAGFERVPARDFEASGRSFLFLQRELTAPRAEGSAPPDTSPGPPQPVPPPRGRNDGRR